MSRFWVVQNNLYNEAGYVRFIEALDHLKIDYAIVKPVPFTNILLPADFDSSVCDVEDAEEAFIPEGREVIAVGATSLGRISKSKGWYPGVFLNDNFDYRKWREGYGNENILSDDGIVGTVDQIENIHGWDTLFVRPIHDTKAFSGTVMSSDEFEKWKHDISDVVETDYSPLHCNTEIMIASPKKIYAEYRMFIVNGEVVTGSMYKQGNRVISNKHVDNAIYQFTGSMIGRWRPAKAFVIDIADTPNGLKVIEINCINSSGFYSADVQQIIMAMHDMDLNRGVTPMEGMGAYSQWLEENKGE